MINPDGVRNRYFQRNNRLFFFSTREKYKIVSYEKLWEMKRRELEKVILKYAGNLEKYNQKIPGAFDKEDIHELRVSYKKLRAFTRLAGIDKEAGDVKIPGKLKALYHAAGRVRDLQLFLEKLTDKLSKDQLQLSYFLKFLHHQLFEAKVLLVKEGEKADFDKIKETLVQHLPGKFQENTVRKFVHRKIAVTRIILLAVKTEKELSEKSLNDMTIQLGDFNDQCITLSLFRSIPDDLPEEEKRTISGRMESLSRQLQADKEILLNQIKQLNLVSNF